MNINSILTFGDTRRMILGTIVAVRDEKMDVTRGMAVFAGFKVLNDNVQVEINAAKMALATEGKAHAFGRVVGMGQRLIGNEPDQLA